MGEWGRGRVSSSVHAGIHIHPPDQADTPQTEQTPPEQTPQDQADTPPPGADTPLGSRLQHTVYERLVRILLECILVKLCVLFMNLKYSNKRSSQSTLSVKKYCLDFINFICGKMKSYTNLSRCGSRCIFNNPTF